MKTEEVTDLNAEELIKPEYLFLKNSIQTKEEALRFLSERALSLGITNDAGALYADFVKRETEMATGLEGGYAIPHTKSKNVKRPAILYLVTEGDIEWGSFEGGVAVRRIFALLFPEKGGAQAHLELLSKLAVCLLDSEFRIKVEEAHDPGALCSYLLARLDEGFGSGSGDSTKS
jgi:PTS system fructose-specific IIA component